MVSNSVMTPTASSACAGVMTPVVVAATWASHRDGSLQNQSGTECSPAPFRAKSRSQRSCNKANFVMSATNAGSSRKKLKPIQPTTAVREALRRCGGTWVPGCLFMSWRTPKTWLYFWWKLLSTRSKGYKEQCKSPAATKKNCDAPSNRIPFDDASLCDDDPLGESGALLALSSPSRLVAKNRISNASEPFSTKCFSKLFVHKLSVDDPTPKRNGQEEERAAIPSDDNKSPVIIPVRASLQACSFQVRSQTTATSSSLTSPGLNDTAS